MPFWTTSRDSLFVKWVLLTSLLLSSCCKTSGNSKTQVDGGVEDPPTANYTPSLGDLVEVPSDLVLAVVPRGPLTRKHISSPALVIDVQRGGGTFRILDSAGQVGWTNVNLRRLGLARPMSTKNELWPELWRGEPVVPIAMPDGPGQLVGASVRHEPDRLGDVGVPFVYRSSPFGMWLIIKAGDASGYVPPTDLRLDLVWDVDAGTVGKAYRGVIQKPFLSGIGATAKRYAPLTDQLPGDGIMTVTECSLEGAFYVPEDEEAENPHGGSQLFLQSCHTECPQETDDRTKTCSPADVQHEAQFVIVHNDQGVRSWRVGSTRTTLVRAKALKLDDDATFDLVVELAEHSSEERRSRVLTLTTKTDKEPAWLDTRFGDLAWGIDAVGTLWTAENAKGNAWKVNAYRIRDGRHFATREYKMVMDPYLCAPDYEDALGRKKDERWLVASAPGGWCTGALLPKDGESLNIQWQD